MCTRLCSDTDIPQLNFSKEFERSGHRKGKFTFRRVKWGNEHFENSSSQVSSAGSGNEPLKQTRSGQTLPPCPRHKLLEKLQCQGLQSDRGAMGRSHRPKQRGQDGTHVGGQGAVVHSHVCALPQLAKGSEASPKHEQAESHRSAGAAPTMERSVARVLAPPTAWAEPRSPSKRGHAGGLLSGRTQPPLVSEPAALGVKMPVALSPGPPGCVLS